MTTPPKTLVLLSHPLLHQSRAGSRMAQAAAMLEHVTVHDLYSTYPDFFIDIEREQQLLLEHEVIVFQHPMFWYSCPALMKEWIDLVLEYGFAYGSQGTKLAGKTWLSVVTTGSGQDAYSGKGDNAHTVDMLLLPFLRTAQLCSMNYLPPLVYNGIPAMDDAQLQQVADDYAQHLQNLKV